MTNKEMMQAVGALIRWFESQDIKEPRNAAYICAITASAFAGNKHSVEELIEIMWDVQRTKP
jgi:preprotein translocase subunit Sec61beta